MRTNRRFESALLFVSCAALLNAPSVWAKPAEKVGAAKSKVIVPLEKGEILKRGLGKQVAVGEQFRLWLSVNASDCNDPIFPGNAGSDDHKFEAYGELKIDGKTEWKVDRRFAVQIRRFDIAKPLEVEPRAQGFPIYKDPHIFMDKHEILFNTEKQGSIARISLKLSDEDDPDIDRVRPADRALADKKDDVIGDFKIDVNLDKLGASDGHYYWVWSGTDNAGNKVGTTLYLYVEHLKTIYGTEKRRPPVIEPKIIDKKFPGKIGGPGPVASKPIIKKSAPAQTK